MDGWVEQADTHSHRHTVSHTTSLPLSITDTHMCTCSLSHIHTLHTQRHSVKTAPHPSFWGLFELGVVLEESTLQAQQPTQPVILFIAMARLVIGPRLDEVGTVAHQPLQVDVMVLRQTKHNEHWLQCWAEWDWG